MTAHSINLGARKAVLIMEGEDGSAVVTTIYDPRIDREFQEYDYETTRLSVGGTNRLTFTTGKMFSTSATPDAIAHAAEVYATARKEALLNESEKLGIMPSADDIMKMNFRTHEEANVAVYLAGIAAGAQQVQFHDERIEKELAEAPLRGVEAVQRELRMLTATKSGKPVQKGLRRALKLAEQVRTTFVQGLSK